MLLAFELSLDDALERDVTDVREKVDVIREYSADLAKFVPKQYMPGAQLTMIAIAHSMILTWISLFLETFRHTTYVLSIAIVLSDEVPRKDLTL
jgi:hypothetical protein